MKPEKDNNKNNNKKLIIIFSVSILILIGLVVAGTYAFFSTTVVDRRTDGDPSTMKTAKLTEFGLQDGPITGSNLIPGDTITKNFSISNQNSGTLNYKLVWTSVTNTFVNKNDLIVTLTSNGTTLISEQDNQKFPDTTTGSVILKDNLTIASGATQNFILTITYKNTSSDQSADMGKIIEGSIAIQ